MRNVFEFLLCVWCLAKHSNSLFYLILTISFEVDTVFFFHCRWESFNKLLRDTQLLSGEVFWRLHFPESRTHIHNHQVIIVALIFKKIKSRDFWIFWFLTWFESWESFDNLMQALDKFPGDKHTCILSSRHRCSTMCTILPALFCVYVGYFWDRVSHTICLGLDLNGEPLDLGFLNN
jgi:hypothetical protein